MDEPTRLARRQETHPTRVNGGATSIWTRWGSGRRSRGSIWAGRRG